MAPTTNELWQEIKEVRHELAEFKAVVFRDYNALLKEAAEQQLAEAKANSIWEVCKRWVPVLTVMVLLSAIVGGLVGFLAYYLKHQP